MGFLEERKGVAEIARREAQAYHNKDMALRMWLASHGGVYVPVNEKNQPDTRLAKMKNRDVSTSSGLSLTLMSPASMMRQVRGAGQGLFGDESRVTSLSPLRKENAPDPWEQESLKKFTEGEKETFELIGNSEHPYVRLMRPLYIKEMCLDCHNYEKGQIGEVGGGVSVTVPISSLIAYADSQTRKWTIDLVLIWLLGIIGLGLTGKRINTHIRQEKEINLRLSEKDQESMSRMALFESMFNSITADAVVFLDTDRRVVMANKVFYERTGYTAEELVGKTCDMFYIDPELFEKMGSIYNEEEAAQIKIPYEMEYKLKDGTIIQTETMASLVKRQDGKILGCLSLIRDITARKRAEENLKAVLERKRAAEVAANAGSWSWNIQAGTIDWSDNLCRIHGISCQEFDGDPGTVINLIHPDDRQRFMWNINTILNEKKPRELSYRILTADKAEKYLTSDTNLIVGKDGEIEKIIGMMRDITDRKKNERERELNEERLNILLRLNEMSGASTDNIIHFGLNECIRLTGSDWGFFQLINPDEKYNEIDLEQFRWSGNVHDQYTDLKDVKEFFENSGIWQHLLHSQNSVIRNDYQGVTPEWEHLGGNAALKRYMGVPVFEQDQLLAIVWVANKKQEYDETDVRQVTLLVKGMFNLIQRKKDQVSKMELEYHLQRACKMEAMGTLAGGIAHDFNNILAIILVSAEVALADITPESPARAKLERIIKASSRARDMVQQILAFSRQAEQRLVKVSPERIVRDALKLLRSTTPSTITLVEDIECEACQIEVDPTQFHQIIMNLFTNAIQAMDEKGTLKVVSEVVEFRENRLFFNGSLPPGNYFKLSVQDDGIGMDAMTMERIFDPFFTTKKMGEGTGMGLAIVARIIQNHKGMIHVESEPGEGSTFDIYFPLVDYEEKLEELEVKLNREACGRILLVDDEEMLADLAGEMLTLEGYQVEVSTESADALELFKANPNEYDLIITDHTMPGMTGMELAKEMLEIRADIPIILLTGYNKKVSEEMVLARGIKKLMYKPFERVNLLNTISTLIHENKGAVAA